MTQFRPMPNANGTFDDDSDTDPHFGRTILTRAVPIRPRKPAPTTPPEIELMATEIAVLVLREVGSFIRAYDVMISSDNHIDALDAMILKLARTNVSFRQFIDEVP